jgi:hypothetical protein
MAFRRPLIPSCPAYLLVNSLLFAAYVNLGRRSKEKDHPAAGFSTAIPFSKTASSPAPRLDGHTQLLLSSHVRKVPCRLSMSDAATFIVPRATLVVVVVVRIAVIVGYEL